MKKYLLLIAASLGSSALFSQTTHTVTNSGNTFNPDTVNAVVGDDVTFTLGSTHSVREVSQATWLANGNTTNGGFTLGSGGGTITMSTAGTFYYVCPPHASSGMKGVIIVSNSNGVTENQNALSVSMFPTPVVDFLTLNVTLDVASEVRIVVYDMLGKIVIDQPASIYSAGLNTLRLNMGSLNGGAYFVKVINGEKIWTGKVIR